MLLAFAVYFVVTTFQRLATLPRWAWPVVTLVLSYGGVLVAHMPWWSGLSIAGISTIINAVEALLTVHIDKGILALQPPNRRTQ